jgi:uncharacterized membrane protein
MPFPHLLCFPQLSEILKSPSPSAENSPSAPQSEARGVIRLHAVRPPADSGISKRPTAAIPDCGDARGVQTQTPSCGNHARVLQFLTPLLLFMLAFCMIGRSMAETYTISWAANQESDLGGYTVHLGTSSGSYSTSYDAGNDTRFTLPPLNPATTYYCAVQAYNIYGLTGAPSNEVSFTTAAAITPAEISIDDDAGNPLINGGANLSFGSIVVGGSGSGRVLIVTNTGGSTLADLTFTLGGPDAIDFSLVDPSVTSLAPGESTAVEILFDPTTIGSRSAELTITSNDTDESVFVVSLLGTGTATPTADVSLFRPDGTELTSNGTGALFGTVLVGSSGSAQVFTIKNVGSAALGNLAISITGANASDFTVSGPSATSLAAGASGTFTITFRPGAAGNRSATLQLASNDPDENPFVLQLAGTGSAVPEIVVTKADGTELTSTASSLSFGAVNIGASSASQTITIRNSGNATLSGIAASIEGAAADFTISSLSSSSLAIGGSLSIAITFKPTASGTRAAVLRIASNDADENPFDIALGGSGVAVPEINVVTADGNTLTDAVSSLDFGSANLGTTSAPKTLQIQSTGSAALGGISIALTGPGAADFLLSGTPGTSIAAGSSASFNLTFQPKSAGARSAVLQIISNDADESPFEINLIGTGVAIPQIEILDSEGVSIASGHPWSFGTVDLGKSTAPKEMLILSTGTANLTGLAANLSGAHASDFIIESAPVATLAPGASSGLRVVFKPTASGLRTATLVIASNSRAGSSFVLQLTGTAAAHPTINVLDPDGIPLADGVTPLAFPSTLLGETSAGIVCSISNSGTADLTNLTLLAGGTHAADFTITAPSAATLKPGQTATFSVTFTPGGTGNRAASLSVQSNDSNRGTITIPLTGKGFGLPELDVLLDGQSLASARVSPVDFGNANTGESGESKTFTIRNTGTAALNGLKISRSGPSSGDFTVSGLETTSLKPGADTTIKVRFNASDKGPREAMLTVSGNDEVSSAVRIPLVGTSIPVSKLELKVAGGTVLSKNRAYIAFPDHTSKSLVITNRGNATLSSLKLVASGIHVDDFEISNLKNTTLAPGKSTTVKIRFDSKGKGNRWGSLTIHSNDPKSPQFEISLVGKGTSSAKSAPGRKAETIPASSPSMRPEISVVRIDGRRYRCITIEKNRLHQVSPAQVEVSSNLVDWQSGERFTTVIEDNESRLKVRDNVPLADGAKRYIRHRKNR